MSIIAFFSAVLLAGCVSTKQGTRQLAPGTTQQSNDHRLQGATSTILAIDAESPVFKVEIDPEHKFPDADRSNNMWEIKNLSSI